MELRLPYNWYPRDYQIPAWKAREGGCKNFALVWHRRAGKDDFALHSTAVESHRRVGNYWHMLPEAAQARKAIWEAVNPKSGLRRIDEAFPPQIRADVRETDMFIRFTNGSTWTVLGSDNYNSLVGTPPVGIVFSEWALAKPDSYSYLRPILVENKGWSMFIYTPRGPNHGLNTYNFAKANPLAWHGEVLTADDTNVFTQEELQNELAHYISEWGEQMGKSLFEQEYYCSFEAAVIGSIYGDQMRDAREAGRVGDFPMDPYLEVGTMWDLGYEDATAIWFFQLRGHAIHFIDYYEQSNVSLSYYREVLDEKARTRGYRYSREHFYFPHDVTAHELQTGKSRRQVLWELGIPVTVVPKHNVLDGIQAVRRNFHRFYFDAEQCEPGLNYLSLYHREWDKDRRTFIPDPVHDYTEHAASALRIGVAMLPDRAPAVMLPGRKDAYRRKKQDEHGPPSGWAM